MKAEMWNKKLWISIINPIQLKEDFNAHLIKSGFEILNFQEHYFTPIGYTALWLLGESHFAIHTFPEECKSYIEISSCNKEYFNRFLKSVKQYKIIREYEIKKV
jgi:S-adenosylmethionine/arginine decarboxylase-like enzyme